MNESLIKLINELAEKILEDKDEIYTMIERNDETNEFSYITSSCNIGETKGYTVIYSEFYAKDCFKEEEDDFEDIEKLATQIINKLESVVF